MKIPFQAILAFGFLFFSGGLCSGGETLRVIVSASPSTFTSVGEKITFTYKIEGDEYISFKRGYSVTDDVADTAPACSQVDTDEMSCTATHTITTEDLALGYITSNVVAQFYVGTSNMISFRPVDLTEKVTTVVYVENFVPSPTPTVTPTLTATPSPEATLTPTTTAATATSTPVSNLDGEVQADKLACRYGPGDLYLYQYGLIKGNKMQVLGRDIHSEWVYVQVQGYDSPCWVNAKYINMNGDIASLEMVYPGKVNIPLSYYWPAPKNVYAARTADGKQVGIYWDEYILPDGEMESPDSPRYLAELWLCKDGELTFNSIFAWQNNLLVDDEAGCSEPSSGVMYLVEKHGYSGPVTIPWPAP